MTYIEFLMEHDDIDLENAEVQKVVFVTEKYLNRLKTSGSPTTDPDDWDKSTASMLKANDWD